MIRQECYTEIIERREVKRALFGQYGGNSGDTVHFSSHQSSMMRIGDHAPGPDQRFTKFLNLRSKSPVDNRRCLIQGIHDLGTHKSLSRWIFVCTSLNNEFSEPRVGLKESQGSSLVKRPFSQVCKRSQAGRLLPPGFSSKRRNCSREDTRRGGQEEECVATVRRRPNHLSRSIPSR
jgi:hypothetical protein